MDAFATFGALNDSQSNGPQKQQFFENDLAQVDNLTGSGSVLEPSLDPAAYDEGAIGGQTQKELDQVRALKLQKDAMGAQHSGKIDEAVALYHKLLDTGFVRDSEDGHPGHRMKYIAFKNIAKILPPERAEESIKFYLKASEIDSSETQLWWKLGMKALEIGNVLLAHNSFAKALTLSDRHWPSIDKILYTGLILNNFRDIIRRALAALQLDRKYGTARLALLKIRDFYPIMFDDSEDLETAESFDLEKCTERDQKIFDKLYSRYEKRWIEYCKFTPLDTPPELLETPNYNILDVKCNKYSFSSIGKSLIRSLEKFDEKDFDRISVAHLAGKKRPFKAIENAQICQIETKKRKKDKSLKLPKKDRNKKALEITEHSSAFSLVIPYLLPYEYRVEFNDCLGSSLNESALEPELIISNAKVESENERRFMVVLREQEPTMLLEFLSFKSSNRPLKIFTFIRDFCLHLTGLTSNQWSNSLKNNFITLWKTLESRRFVEIVLSDDVRADIMEMKPTKIVRLFQDFKGYLLFAELEVDAEMVRRGLRLGPACLSPGNDGKDSLDDPTRSKNQRLARYIRQMFMYPSEMYSGNCTEVRLRLMWLDAKMWVLRNDAKFMLQRLMDIQVFLVKNDHWEVNIPNIKEAPVISLAETEKRIQTIQRAEQREEVERLYQDGNYKQVAELLWVTLRLKPSTAEIQPFPQERANQLCLLLNSLSFIAQNDEFGWKTWAQGIERAFAEVAARIRVRHSLPDWVNAAGQLCLNFLELDTDDYSTIFEGMSKSEMGRFQRSLATFSAAQMELGPEPAVIRRSLVPVWLIGYHALNELENDESDNRKISSESSASEESQKEFDEATFDMKQLRFYPDLEIAPCVQLLITAHSELGSCNWCTDGNGSLLKFIIPTFNALRKKLKADPDGLDSAKPKIVNLLNNELQQAIYCFVQFPAKKPKSITDHRSTKIPLSWQNVVLVFDVLFPEELPQFDSVKSNSISSELASFIKKCIPLIPDCEFSKMRLGYSKIIRATHEAALDDSYGDLKSWLEMKSADSPLENFYYLLADYCMKNNSRDDAVKYYFMDIGFNPQRIDSWAAVALCKAAEIDEKMRCFDSKGQFLPMKLIHCAIFCFERALELERNGKILIEFGQMLYWLAGYDSEQSHAYYQKSYALFEEALAVAPEEAWLTHYMLGKLSEKLRKDTECLDHYHNGLEWMHEFASYPAKIQSKLNSGSFNHETLEVFYRITAFITKRYEAGEDVFELRGVVWGLLQMPVFTRNGEEKVDLKNVKFETAADVIQQCIRNYELILKRYPQHYKSYYRLAKLAYHADNPSLAKKIILVEKNSSSDKKEPTKAGKFIFNHVGSLFGERNRHNFFGGIWRTPCEDIDRPGAFSRHLAKCCRLVVLCAEKTHDIVLLATIFSALQRTPDASKRYLKEVDRELIYKPIISTILSCQELMIKQQLSHIPARKRLVKFHRITEILQKKIIGSETFSKLQEFMKKAFALAQPSQTESRSATLETINKYVKAIVAMEKAIAESPDASDDVQAYLKKKHGDQIQTSISKVTPLVPAPALPKPTIPPKNETSRQVVAVIQPSTVIDLTGSSSPKSSAAATSVKQTSTAGPINPQLANPTPHLSPSSIAALFAVDYSKLNDQQRILFESLRRHLSNS